MTIEKDVVISLLRLTQNGQIRIGLLRKDARIPAEVIDQVLHKLSESDFVHLQLDIAEASSSQRIKMAVHAIQLGADLEQVCKMLKWTEFESITAHVFEANNFQVVRNFRFKQAHKRWEIDILGCKQPFIACVDCKHWLYEWRKNAIIKAVDAQVERTQAFASVLPLYCKKVWLKGWKTAVLIPIVLSLFPGPLKFYKNVPTVPVLQIQDFINGMSEHADELTHFSQKILEDNINLMKFIK
jgi:hypothetical protein